MKNLTTEGHGWEKNRLPCNPSPVRAATAGNNVKPHSIRIFIKLGKDMVGS
jgi:hypothetical protein